MTAGDAKSLRIRRAINLGGQKVEGKVAGTYLMVNKFLLTV